MKKTIVILVWIGGVFVVWYDGVKHGYQMVVEDSCANPPASSVAGHLQRL